MLGQLGNYSIAIIGILMASAFAGVAQAGADELPSFLSGATLGDQIDLIQATDIDKNSRSKSWTKSDEGLVSNKSGLTLLTFPEKLPEKYVLIATLQRVERNDSLGIGFRVGDSGTILMLNFAGGKSSGFYYLDDLKPGDEANESATTENMISDQKASELVLAVLDNRVIVTIDGKPHIDWKGTPDRLSVKGWNGINQTDQLTLSTYYSSWKISELKFQPILKMANAPIAAITGKPSEPDSKAIQEATRNLEKKLGYEFKANGALASQTLANKLLTELLSEKDPLNRFVIFTKSIELSAQGGDREKSLQTIEQLSNEFEIDVISHTRAVIESVAKLRSPPPPFYLLAIDSFQLAETALDRHDYKLARDLLNDAQAYARRSGSKSLAAQLALFQKPWREWENSYGQVQADHTAAIGDPANESANNTWGQFLCFKRGQWEEGLVYLARGMEQPLSDLAQRELSMKWDYDSALGLMNDWLDAATSASKEDIQAIEDHAYAVGQTAFLYAQDDQVPLLEEKIGQRFGRTRFWDTRTTETGLELGHPQANIGDEGTVELWLRTTDSDGCVIKKRLESGESTIGMRIQNGTVAYYAQGYNYARFLFSKQKVNDGLWRHLAIVKQGDQLTLFIDGKKEAVANEIRPELKSKANWHIGYSRVDNRLPLHASFARIRVSSVARYHVPFSPETQYGADRATLFLE